MIILDGIRVILGILLTLFIPGFLLNLILFKKQDWVERVFLGIALSIFVDVSLGMFLGFNGFMKNLTGGITEFSSWVYLILVSCAFLVVYLSKKERSLISFKGDITKNIEKTNISRFSNFLFLLSLILSLSVLLYISLLHFYNLPSVIFHFLYVSNIILIAWLVLFRKLSSKKTLFLIIFYIICLQLVIPIRQPYGVISNYPDQQYENQIVMNIINTGRLDFNFGTGESKGYVFHPALELLVSFISIATNLSPEFILKYLGIFLNILTLCFLYQFFKKFLDKRKSFLSLLIAGSCSIFIYFYAFTTHTSLAFPYITLFLYTFNLKSLNWRFITLISIFLIVISHHFSSIIFSSLLIISLISNYFFNTYTRKKIRLNKRMVLFLVGLTFMWLFFIASTFFLDFLKVVNTAQDKFVYTSQTIINYYDYKIKTNFFPESINLNLTNYDNSSDPENIKKIMDEYESKYKKPNVNFVLNAPKSSSTSAIRIIGNSSLILFGLIISLGFFIILFKKDTIYLNFLPYSFASGILFIIFTFIWSFGYGNVTDLYPRIFVYLYFLASPLAVYWLSKYDHFKLTIVRLVPLLLLIILLFNSWYYNSHVFYYDPNSPIILEDVRDNLISYKSTGNYLNNFLPEIDKFWSDKLMFSFGGSYGYKTIYQFPYRTNIFNWIKSHLSTNHYVILDEKIINKKFYHTGNLEEIELLIDKNNVYYSSGKIKLLRIN